MTVTVRPYPKRTYQNGIRPFRPVVPANNIRPYTLKTWRPPVPEPLSPAPLLGPKELLGLGLLALVQLWGWAASRPKRVQNATPEVDIAITGTVPGPGETVGGTFCFVQKAGSATFSLDPNDCDNQTTINYDEAPAVCVSNAIAIARVDNPGPCGPKTMGWDVTRADGTIVRRAAISTSWGFRALSIPVEVSFDGPTAMPYVAPTVTVPLPDGYEAPSPDVEPVPQPLPRRVYPLPLIPLAPPLTEPGGPTPLPGIDPNVVPTTPGPAAPPATAPQVPRRTVPLPLPGATPTRDGAIAPQAPAPAAVTPPDAHFPVPGAPPVTGNGPRPTPEGIAQELGRLEQKLARLSDPGPEGPGDGSDRLQLLFDLIGRLIEFTTSMTSGGGYSLSSPCELDENGDRIVSTVEYAGAANSFGVLANKIDALAGVLQVHKDLKQPICKQTPAVGQPVTVDFLQVD